METSKFLYLFLLALRFIMTLLPQSGYIHPDEYFQNPEIVYGDVFGLLSFRSWEFKVDKPIRSIVFPYITTGIPALFMNTFGAKQLFGTKFFPYMLLVLPRLFMCFLSLLNDVCLFRLSKLLGKKPFQALSVYASSYVTLIYFTRTLSNSLEATCFTLLNYFVISEFIDLKRAAKLSEHARRTILRESDNTYYAYGILLAAGFFIRPTYAIFAMTPIIFWILVCLNTENRIVRCVQFILSVTVTSFLFIIVDTVYYNHDFDNFLNFKSMSLQKVVLTPFNFIVYNINTEKIGAHGYHPWYLHFIVNVPLMFSVLGIYGLVHFAQLLLLMAKRIELNVSALELFMLLSFTAPVCFLSFIPHQEPRFLLPLICPLICLYGDRLYTHCCKHKWLVFLWVFTNGMGGIFFGFFHQGGMVKTLSYLHTVSAKNMARGMDIVFFHTYMPPRHLLAMEESQKAIDFIDLGGSSDDMLLSTVQRILHNSHHRRKLYVIMPSSLTIPIVNVNIFLSPRYRVKMERKFFPHLSIEDLPSIYNLWHIATGQSSVFYRLRKMREFFCLNVYRIEPVQAA